MLETTEKTSYNETEERSPNVRNSNGVRCETWRDMACRHLLSHTDVLALILSNCVPEFKDMALKDVEKCIGYVDVDAAIPVDATGTNRIFGISNVDYSLDNEPIIYDMHFLAHIPEDRITDGKLVAEMHINIEAQRVPNPGYYLPKRATYYASRLIASQKGIDWKNSDYNQVRRVYSVWLCTMPPKGKSGFINHYGIVENLVYGNVSFPKEQYTDFNYIIIGLNDMDSANAMVKAFSGYFSDITTPQEKYMYLEEAGITVTADMVQRTEAMYSLSKDFEERGMAQGMARQNLELVRRVIATKGMTFNEAVEYLCLTAEEVDAIKPLFEKENQ